MYFLVDFYAVVLTQIKTCSLRTKSPNFPAFLPIGAFLLGG